MLPKKKNKKLADHKPDGNKVKDYSNDPFVIEKTEAAKKVIERYGLPKQLLAGKK